MLQKFKFFGLIGYVVLTLFGVSAEYDPSVEDYDSNVVQISSIPNVDDTFLRSPSLDSLSSSTSSQTGIANSDAANILTISIDNSPNVLTVIGSPSISNPLTSDTYSTSTNSISTSKPSFSLSPNSESERTSSSTSVNLGSSSNDYLQSITNYVSSTGSSVSSTVNSASSTENSVSGNSGLSTGYADSSTGNFLSKTEGSLSGFSSFLSLPEEAFPNSFSNAALSVPFIQNFLNLEITGSTAEDILNKVAFKVVKDNGHSNPADIAGKVSKDAYSLKVLTIPLYFQAVENALSKFLRSEGIVVIPYHFKSYSVHIENALKSTDVNNIKSVYQALSNGFVNFILSLGFNIIEKADILAQLFNTELIALRKS